MMARKRIGNRSLSYPSFGVELMRSLAARAIALVLVPVIFVGCGGSQQDGSQFQHDQAATLFLEAIQARQTDQAKAVELLTQSIESRPSHNAYYQRAWIHGLQGRDNEARADVAKGLELEPENKQLKWLEGELKKPANRRKLDGPPTPAK
jgi:hypothetical protein